MTTTQRLLCEVLDGEFDAAVDLIDPRFPRVTLKDKGLLDDRAMQKVQKLARRKYNQRKARKAAEKEQQDRKAIALLEEQDLANLRKDLVKTQEEVVWLNNLQAWYVRLINANFKDFFDNIQMHFNITERIEYLEICTQQTKEMIRDIRERLHLD